MIISDHDHQSSCAKDFIKTSFLIFSDGETVEVNPKILLHDLKPGEDEGSVVVPGTFFCLK